MKSLLYSITCCLFFTACLAQDKKVEADRPVGGPCQGCEAIYEYGDRALNPIDTLPGFMDTEPKLKVLGTVYQKDGKTPAKDVILYFYQTNRAGIYPTQGAEEGWAQRHGTIRGWIKTDSSGQYTLYTFRPAAYPNRLEPEHIHITVKEPGISEYYIDVISFKDDPLLTPEKQMQFKNRGGSGLVEPTVKNGILTVERDIILGHNIPDY